MKQKSSGLIRSPIRCGNVDPEIQAFIEAEYWNISPYPGGYTKSAQELFNACLFEFGERRCNGLLEIQTH